MDEKESSEEENEQTRNLKRTSSGDTVFPSPVAKRFDFNNSAPLVPPTFGSSASEGAFIFAPNLESPSSMSTRFKCSVGDPVQVDNSNFFDVGISSEDKAMESLTSLDRDMMSSLNNNDAEDNEEIDFSIKLLPDDLMFSKQIVDDNGNENVDEIEEAGASCSETNKSPVEATTSYFDKLPTKAVPMSVSPKEIETIISPEIGDTSWADIQLFSGNKFRQDSLEVQNSDMSESIDMSTSEVYDDDVTQPGAASASDTMDNSFIDMEYKSGLSHGGSSFSSISSIQDDNIQITRKKKKKKKKSKTTTDEDGEERSSTPMALRPNYFVGIQVTNPEIHRAVVEVQQNIIDSYPEFAKALVDVATLHLTLLVAHISDEDSMHVACSALDKSCNILERTLLNEPLKLTFSGLSHFSHQTLYVKLVEDENFNRLLQLSQEIRKIFLENDVFLPDEKEFYPHLTIIKLSRAPHGKKRIRRFDDSMYEMYKSAEFGTQLVTSLQLLSMHKPKNECRYYNTARQITLDVISNEDQDHSKCCFPRLPDISLLPIQSPSIVFDLKSKNNVNNKEKEQQSPTCISINDKTDAAIKVFDTASTQQQPDEEFSLLSDIQKEFDIKPSPPSVGASSTSPLVESLLDKTEEPNPALDVLLTPQHLNPNLLTPVVEDANENHSEISNESFISNHCTPTHASSSEKWVSNYVISKESESLLNVATDGTSPVPADLPEEPKVKDDSSNKSAPGISNSWILPVAIGAVSILALALGAKLLSKK